MARTQPDIIVAACIGFISGLFHYVPPAAATPASYTPAAKPSKPLNLTPHKRG